MADPIDVNGDYPGNDLAPLISEIISNDVNLVLKLGEQEIVVDYKPFLDVREVFEAIRLFLYLNNSKNKIPQKYTLDYISFSGANLEIFEVPDTVYYYDLFIGDDNMKSIRLYGAWDTNVIVTIKRIIKNYETIFGEKLNITEGQQLPHVELLYDYVQGKKLTSYEYFNNKVYIYKLASRHNNPNATNPREIEIQAGHLKLMQLLEENQEKFQKYLFKHCIEAYNYVKEMIIRYGLNIKIFVPELRDYLDSFGNIYFNHHKINTKHLSQTTLLKLGQVIGPNKLFNEHRQKIFELYRTDLTMKEILKLPDSPEKLIQLTNNRHDRDFDILVFNKLVRKYRDKIKIGSSMIFDGLRLQYSIVDLDEDNFKALFLDATLDCINEFKITEKSLNGTGTEMSKYIPTFKQYIKQYYDMRKNNIPKFYVDFLKHRFNLILDQPVKVYDGVKPKTRNDKIMTYILATCNYENCRIKTCALKIPTSKGDKYIIKNLFHEDFQTIDVNQKLYIPDGIYYDLDLEMYLPESSSELILDDIIQESIDVIEKELEQRRIFRSRYDENNLYDYISQTDERIRKLESKLEKYNGPVEDLDSEIGGEILYSIYGI